MTNINQDLQKLAKPITWFKPDPRNAKKHNKRSIQAISLSLKEFKQNKPVVALADGTVKAGNGTLQAAISLGWTELAGVVFEDEEKAMAYAIADNRSAEFSEWDDDELRISVSELMAAEIPDIERAAIVEALGFNDKEMADVLRGAAPDADAEEIPEHASGEPDSKIGMVYELGPHRLACGDSTNPEVLAAVLRGERPQMVWTDPPYGVSYVGGNHGVYSPEARLAAGGLVVMNDTLDEPSLQRLLFASLGQVYSACEDGSAIYCAAPAGPLFYVFGTVLRELDWWRQTLVWVKSSLVMGRSNYHYRHEAIFYGVKGGAAAFFTKDRTEDTVLEFDRPSRNGEHPTMKPVPLVMKCIENSSQLGWLVMDPFGGSGTTLIAAAETNRRACLIELSPSYCDVIRRRWTRWAKEHNRDLGTGALEDAPTGNR
jgi:site-specific DNA-methyltransferase (adenine-specific)